MIRPLIYVWEESLRALSGELECPVVDCSCTVSEEARPTRRHEAKRLLAELEARVPGAKQNLLVSMKRVHLTQLLAPEFLRGGAGVKT